MKARKLIENMEITRAISWILERGAILQKEKATSIPRRMKKAFRRGNFGNFLACIQKRKMLMRTRNAPSVCERLSEN